VLRHVPKTCLVLFLYFTIQVTATILRSEPAVTVVCSSEVLCLYRHRLCWTDIAVGFLVWYLKDNTMNRLTVKVWQSMRRFLKKNGLLLESKTALANCMRIQQRVHSSMLYDRRTDGRQLSASNTLWFWWQSNNHAETWLGAADGGGWRCSLL